FRSWFSLLDPVASVMVPALAESLVMTEPQPPVFREVTLALTERRRVPETVAAFQAILDHLDGQPEPPLAEVEARDRIAKRRSAAAAGLAELGALDRVWPLLRHDEDPRLRAFVIDRFARFAVNPRGLLDRLNTAEVDPVELQGVLMTLAEMRESRPERLSPTTLEEIATSAAALLRDHDDSGVHSAAELVLRRIGRGDLIFSATSAAGVTDAPLGRSRWYLGHNGHTFAVVRLEGGWRGTYPHEDGYDPVEARQYVQIGRTVAVSTREVTRGQIQRLRLGAEHDDSAGNTDDHPANTVTWYEAARYCNRLSDLAGLPRCYPEPIGPNMVLDADAVKAGGYRLPTEAEWELLCRAGTLTARPFGDSDVLQGRYACGWINSSDKTLPVGRLLPNELGLFDMLGNLWEWCHDADMVPDFSQSNRHVSPYPAGTPEAPAVERLVTETIEPLGIEGAPSVDTVRVTRGGAYDYANSQARSGKRSDGKPGDALNYDGFRVVRTIMSN
ncbi:MAG: formylglycine-generating enzyme family protein, partial [Isosphaeraceae bacterium]